MGRVTLPVRLPMIAAAITWCRRLWVHVVVRGVGGGGGGTFLLSRFKAGRFRRDEVSVTLELRERIEARNVFFDIEVRLRREGYKGRSSLV